MFGIIPRPLWSKSAPPDELNRIDLALRVWCIKVGARLLVVDTGIGDYHPDKFNQQFDVRGPAHPLNLALQSVGLDAQQVTDLVITHLHFDHVGGMGYQKEGKMLPTFPNATLHLQRQHWEYSKHPTERDAGSFLAHYYAPLVQDYEARKKIHFIDGEEGLILSEGAYELRFRCSHGHTPHLMHPYDQTYIYLADLIPTSNHVHVPWVMGYDISPGVTTKEKRQLLDWVIQKNLKVIFEHDPVYWGSSIIKDEKGNFRPGDKFAHGEASAIRA